LTVRSGTVAEAPPRARTFIETARRAQIVAAAIDTIAELGYAHASLTRIAERLDISKGVILYHFAGKDDLIRAVIADVIARAEAYMQRRIQAAPPGAAKLRVYIESNIGFMAEYRNDVIALVDMSRNARGANGTWLFERAILDKSVADLQQLLSRLQSSGELRTDFDPAAVAFAIRATIDAAASRLARDPDLNIELYARELARLFERATRTRAR
jgi:AcrR family transcriptional regulator